MARIGYARVSTADQRLDRQLDELEAEGCERVFTEKISGAASTSPSATPCSATSRRATW